MENKNTFLPEMEWSPEWFHVASKSQEFQVLQLVAVEITAHVDGLTSDDDDFVAVQDEFSDCGGQSAHQMATGINHDRLKINEQF